EEGVIFGGFGGYSPDTITTLEESWVTITTLEESWVTITTLEESWVTITTLEESWVTITTLEESWVIACMWASGWGTDRADGETTAMTHHFAEGGLWRCLARVRS